MGKGEMPNRGFPPSSGKVFSDSNLPHADDLLAEAESAPKIVAEIGKPSGRICDNAYEPGGRSGPGA